MKSKSRKFGPRLTVSLTGEDYDMLSALAEKDEVSVAWVVRRAIGNYLQRHKREFDYSSNESQQVKDKPSRLKAS